MAERRDKKKYPDEFWQKLSRELDAYREHEFKQEPLTSTQRLIWRILGRTGHAAPAIIRWPIVGWRQLSGRQRIVVRAVSLAVSP